MGRRPGSRGADDGSEGDRCPIRFTHRPGDYVGLSTEPKPTGSPGALAGRKFHELDTLRVYKYRVNGWEPYALEVQGEVIAAVAPDLIRPNDTTDYAEGDVIAGPLIFADIGRVPLRGGYLTGARMRTTKADWETAVRLHLFRAALQAAPADNAILEVANADVDAWLGTISFPEPAVKAPGRCAAVWTGQPVPIQSDGLNRVYGLLEALDVATPAAGQRFSVTLEVERN